MATFNSPGMSHKTSTWMNKCATRGQALDLSLRQPDAAELLFKNQPGWKGGLNIHITVFS